MDFNPFQIVSKVTMNIQAKMSEQAANSAGKFLSYCAGASLLILSSGVIAIGLVLANR